MLMAKIAEGSSPAGPSHPLRFTLQLPRQIIRVIHLLSAQQMKLFRSPAFQIGLVVCAAAAWKALFLLWNVVPFNADEAVVALMARHILIGERPVFFYGQAYMGSLDAYLVAAGFLLFGQQVWLIRLVQSLLYLGTIFTTYLIAKEAFGSQHVAVLAGA